MAHGVSFGEFPGVGGAWDFNVRPHGELVKRMSGPSPPLPLTTWSYVRAVPEHLPHRLAMQAIGHGKPLGSCRSSTDIRRRSISELSPVSRNDFCVSCRQHATARLPSSHLTAAP
jgi:hypothetical protein